MCADTVFACLTQWFATILSATIDTIDYVNVVYIIYGTTEMTKTTLSFSALVLCNGIHFLPVAYR